MKRKYESYGATVLSLNPIYSNSYIKESFISVVSLFTLVLLHLCKVFRFSVQVWNCVFRCH